MKSTYKIFFDNLLWFAVLTVFINGCDYLNSNNDDCDPGPAVCDEIRPTQGNLLVRVTINGNNTQVPVHVFRGDFELNDKVLDTLLVGSGMVLTLPIVDQGYSAVAEYIQSDGDTVIAIDGDDISFDKDVYCDKTCYGEATGTIDVRLHFPKK